MKGRKMTTFKGILVLIFIALTLIFIFQNSEMVEIKFLFWSMSVSRALMLAGTLFVGIISGWLTGSIARARKLSRQAPRSG